MTNIGTCFRFYTQMRVQKKTKHLHIEFIVTSHNSAVCELTQLEINHVTQDPTVNI